MKRKQSNQSKQYFINLPAKDLVRLDDFPGYILDVYGTLYKDNQPVPLYKGGIYYLSRRDGTYTAALTNLMCYYWLSPKWFSNGRRPSPFLKVEDNGTKYRKG